MITHAELLKAAEELLQTVEEEKQLLEHTIGVLGDFDRMEYSRHHTQEAAEKAAKSLANRWGNPQDGSGPVVVKRSRI